MDSNVTQLSTFLKALLACGVIASVLRFATDRLAGMLWNGYDFIARSASELSSVGAPTRVLVLSLDILSGCLMIVFGVGVWLIAGQNMALRIAAGLIIANAVISLVAEMFFPPRYDAGLGTNASTPNVILMAVGMFSFVLAIAFGAAAFHGWFRVFSVGILLAYIVLTVVGLTVHRAPGPSGELAPTIGVQERTMMYSYLLWMATLAIVLLRGRGAA